MLFILTVADWSSIIAALLSLEWAFRISSELWSFELSSSWSSLLRVSSLKLLLSSSAEPSSLPSLVTFFSYSSAFSLAEGPPLWWNTEIVTLLFDFSDRLLVGIPFESFFEELVLFLVILRISFAIVSLSTLSLFLKSLTFSVLSFETKTLLSFENWVSWLEFCLLTGVTLFFVESIVWFLDFGASFIDCLLCLLVIFDIVSSELPVLVDLFLFSSLAEVGEPFEAESFCPAPLLSLSLFPLSLSSYSFNFSCAWGFLGFELLVLTDMFLLLSFKKIVASFELESFPPILLSSSLFSLLLSFSSYFFKISCACDIYSVSSEFDSLGSVSPCPWSESTLLMIVLATSRLCSSSPVAFKIIAGILEDTFSEGVRFRDLSVLFVMRVLISFNVFITWSLDRLSSNGVSILPFHSIPPSASFSRLALARLSSSICLVIGLSRTASFGLVASLFLTVSESDNWELISPGFTWKSMLSFVKDISAEDLSAVISSLPAVWSTWNINEHGNYVYTFLTYQNPPAVVSK